jgi:hypothetical protein
MSSSDRPATPDDSDDDIQDVGPHGQVEEQSPHAGPVAYSGRGLLKSLSRRWLVATPFALLVATIAAVAVWFLLPPSQQVAYVRLYMPRHVEGNFNEHPEGEVDFDQFQRQQFALLRSRTVVDAVFRDEKVRQLDLNALTKGGNPADWLEGQIRIEFPDGPELPRVALSGDSPETLKVLVTALRDTYLEEVVNKQTQSHRQARLDKLKEIRALYEGRLKTIKETHRKLAVALGGNTDRLVELQQELKKRELEAAKDQLIEVRGKLTELQVETKLAENRVKAGNAMQVPVRDVEAQVEKALAKELEALAKLQSDLAKARELVAAEGDAGVRRLRLTLDEKTAAIAAQRQALRTRFREELQQKASSDAQAELTAITEKIKYYQEFENVLDKETQQLTKLTDKLNVDALDIEDSKTELQLAQEGYQKAVKEIDKLQVEMPAPPRVRKWEDAVVVTPDDTPRKVKAAGLAGLGGFLAVLLLASFVRFDRAWGGSIPTELRMDTLFRIGCGLRAKGRTAEEILAAVRTANCRCVPPLEDAEVAEIARACSQYAPGHS